MELTYQDSVKEMTGASFWDRLTAIPGAVEARLPTLDKSLDAYFDRHFVQIIEEWDLLTESDLEKYERRLSHITDEISGLCADRTKTEARVQKLKSLIASMEAGS